MAYSNNPVSDSGDPSFKRQKEEWDKGIDPEQFKKMLQYIRKNPCREDLRERDYMLFAMMGNMGLRVGEVAIVEREHFKRLRSDDGTYYDLPIATVPVLKKRKRARCHACGKDYPLKKLKKLKCPKCGQKCEKIKKIPLKNIDIHPRVAKAICEYMDTQMAPRQPWFFEGMTGNGHMGERGIRKIFYHYVRECGFTEKYSTHAMRHMFGSRCWEATKDMAYVSRQLGHSTIDRAAGSTNLYIHVSESKRIEYLDKLGYIL